MGLWVLWKSIMLVPEGASRQTAVSLKIAVVRHTQSFMFGLFSLSPVRQHKGHFQKSQPFHSLSMATLSMDLLSVIAGCLSCAVSISCSHLLTLSQLAYHPASVKISAFWFGFLSMFMLLLHAPLSPPHHQPVSAESAESSDQKSPCKRVS